MKIPSAHQAEKCAIGLALIGSEDMERLASLSPDLFFFVDSKTAVKKMVASHSKGLRQDAEIDTDHVQEFTNSISMSMDECVEILKEKATARKLLFDCKQAIDDLQSGSPVDLIAEKLTQAASSAHQQDSTIVSIGQSLGEVFDDIRATVDGTKVSGYRTGLDVDKLVGGFEKGRFYVIAARPAMGKSAFALDVVKRISEQGYGVGFMSLEMSHSMLSRRLLTAHTGIEAAKIKNGHLSDDDMVRIADSCGTLASLQIHFDDSSHVTASTLRSKAIQLKQRKDVDMLVVDYLQLMTGSNDSRERDIAEASRTCKVLSRELDMPVIALAQLNRGVEMRDNKRPRLSDLRESGAIEQDADVVMMLYRPEYYGIEKYPMDDAFTAMQGKSTKNVCEVHVVKHRDGETGATAQIFVPELMQFKNREFRLESAADMF